MTKYRTYIRTAVFGNSYAKSGFSDEHIEANRQRLKELTNHWRYIGWDDTLARLLDISNTQMSRILNCYSKLSLETVIKLAWLCNTTVDHILQLEDQIDMLDPTLKKYMKR